MEGPFPPPMHIPWPALSAIELARSAFHLALRLAES